jgi:hypothetical protein
MQQAFYAPGMSMPGMGMGGMPGMGMGMPGMGMGMPGMGMGMFGVGGEVIADTIVNIVKGVLKNVKNADLADCAEAIAMAIAKVGETTSGQFKQLLMYNSFLYNIVMQIYSMLQQREASRAATNTYPQAGYPQAAAAYPPQAGYPQAAAAYPPQAGYTTPAPAAYTPAVAAAPVATSSSRR